MKKLVLFIGIVSISIVSCKKTTTPTPTIAEDASLKATTVSQVIEPKGDFTLTVNKDGSFSSSDMTYVNSFPQLQAALTKTGLGLTSNDPSTVTFSVDNTGRTTSTFMPFDGKNYTLLLADYGQFRFFEDNLTAVYGKEGFKSISHPEIFTMFPALEEKLANIGNEIKNNLGNGGDVEITLTPDFKIIVDGVVYNSNALPAIESEWAACVKSNGSGMWALYVCAYLLFNPR
ncbi:MAG: hypothetical protein WC044_04130 [Crocinitomicaceae bacterium]